MLLNIMGFGETPEQFSRRRHADRDKVFEDSLSVLADALGIPIENFTLTTEFALTRVPFALTAGACSSKETHRSISQ
jgi:hypothetical protein